MKDFLQKFKAGGQPAGESAEPRLSLAAFGKHPGWDDHIPGIGVETEALAHVKHAFYVGGVGKQIDSGAWEKLEPEKRLEGFDHIFLWLRAGHVLLGELWSSSDRKGRSKYPMVLCVDSEGVSTGFLLARVLPDLEHLRAACKAAVSAEQVTVDCNAAQNQLRVLTGSVGRTLDGMLRTDAQQRFLERSELGPDRLGLLRVLHELGSASGARARHLRLPLACDSRVEALQLWAAFLRCVVPDAVPLLLLARGGVDWIEVIIGEPTGDELFCLQASPKALPLATEIPYDLPPELKQRLQTLENRFLATDSSVTGVEKKPVPAAAVKSSETRTTEPAPPRRGPGLGVVIGVVVAVLAGAAGVWLFRGSGGTAPETKRVEAKVESPPSNPPPVKPDDYDVAMKEARAAMERKDFAAAMTQSDRAIAARAGDPAALELKRLAVDERTKSESTLTATRQEQQRYDTAVADGRAAFGRKDFAGALTKADAALAIRSNDAVAMKLRSDAAAAQVASAAQAARDRDYETAMKEAQAALDTKDFAAAVRAANRALEIRTNDAAAMVLRQRASEEKVTVDSAVAVAQQLQGKYDVAMAAGRDAFDRNDYTNAIAQATIALEIRTNDPAATKLKFESKAKLGAAVAAVAQQERQQQQYDTVLAEGRAALERTDYAGAIVKAETALGIKTNDPAALKLKSEAQTQQRVVAAQTERERNYQQAMDAGRAAYGRNDYAAALAQAELALTNRTNDAAAQDLKKRATDGKDLQDAQTLLSQGSYDKALLLCAAHPDAAAFSQLAGQITGKQAKDLDIRFERLLVWFDVLSPKDAKTPEARKEKGVDGEIGMEKDTYLREAEELEQSYTTKGLLNADRQKNFKALKKNIRDHL